MSVFEPNSRHLWEIWFFAFIWRKVRLRLIECSQILMVRLLLVKERVVSGFSASRAVILMSRTGMGVEKNKFSKTPNWRHYLLKTRAKARRISRIIGSDSKVISKRREAMEMIQKQGNWVLHELKPRDVERRFFACEQLLQRHNLKGLLHRIVTGD